MAYTTTLTLHEGDQKPVVEFNLYDAEESPLPLWGVTVRFKVAHPNGTSNIVDGECEIMDAANGKCRYYMGKDELSDPGYYECELELTYAHGEVATTNKNVIKVLEDTMRALMRRSKTFTIDTYLTS